MALVDKPVLLFFGTRHVQIGLVDIIVFGTNVEFVWFFLRKLHRVNSNQGLLIVLRIWVPDSLIEHVEIYFRIV